MIKRLIICFRCNAQTRNSIKRMIDCEMVSKLIVSALTPLARLISTVFRCRTAWRLQDMRKRRIDRSDDDKTINLEIFDGRNERNETA
ncbi:hypothetical protein [Massilia sp. X63]|uniref:hypothetical protein n=1 Tax=Massilia sp. X63 TaxID=3237285 RepID=UPI0034DD3CCB